MKFRPIVLALLLILFVPLVVQAEVDGDALRDKIKVLRSEHQELKQQVAAGTLNREQARATWKEKIEAVRMEKEKYFESKMVKFQSRYAKIAERSPERAESLSARFEVLKINREDRKTQRKMLLDKVRSGDISPEEAKLRVKAKRAENKIIQETRKSDRQDRPSDRKRK